MPNNSVSLKSLVHDVTYLSETRHKVFQELTSDRQVAVFRKLSRHVQKKLARKIDYETLLHLLKAVDPDEATAILRFFRKSKQDRLMHDVSDHLREQVSLLLKFDPNTAAGLMNLDYITVKPNESLKSVISHIKEYEEKRSKVPTVLVQNKTELLGFVPLYQLALTDSKTKLSELTKTIASIKFNAPYQSILEKIRDNAHSKVVVLSEEDEVMGIIYADDVLSIVEEQASSSLYDFAGVQSEESINDSVRRKIQFRYKWLMINLATSFLAAFTVGLFDNVIARNILLAVYMPIVAGMGGNAGAQTFAIMVRSLSISQVSRQLVLATLRKEVLAALVNGLINGVLVTTFVTLMDGDFRVGITLGLALVLNLINGATFGTLIPVLMKRLGKDPASSATIFISTSTDVLGFFAFLSLASFLVK